jgi:hypothetical protein
MDKLTLIALLTFYSSILSAQQDLLVFKKENKAISYLKKYSYINFQLKNHQWYTGYITKVQNDSFYVSTFVVHYSLMGADSVHYAEFPVAIGDVYAMPKKGVQFGYPNDRVTINPQAGHVYWAWIKNGWLLKAGAGGYVALYVINGLVKNNFTFSGSKFGIAAAIFLAGEILHQTYKPSLRMGKKYHLESVKISSQTN